MVDRRLSLNQLLRGRISRTSPILSPYLSLTGGPLCALLVATASCAATKLLVQILSGDDRVRQLTKTVFNTTATAAMAAVLAFANPALAQSGNFALELNTATDIGDGCQLTYVATNNTGIALVETAYQVALFDENSLVTGTLVLEFGALPVGKTKVVQFNLAGKKCGSISRILINDVSACKSADGDHDFCMSGLITNSRSDIQLGV